MGSLVGHVLPGFAFLALGLWHLFNNIKLFCLNRNTFTSSIWFPVSKLRHLELYLIIFSSLSSISMELFIGPRRHHPFDAHGTIPSNHLRNFEHSAMGMSFLVYAVFALVLDRPRPRASVPEGLTTLIAAAAFTQQLLLFHFHSADHKGMEGQYHLTLQLIIFVSLLTTLMGIAMPKSFLVSFVRSSSIAFQGMWFMVTGCMLYTPSLIPKGCYIFDEGQHKLIKCSSEEALHRAKSLVNIEFSWLFVINTIFVVTLYLILDRVYGENVEYSSLSTKHKTEPDDEEEQHFELTKSAQNTSFVQMGKLFGHDQKL